MMLLLQQILLSGINPLLLFVMSNKTSSLPGTSEADAERRRKKALAVLSKRLQSVETQEEAWSDDDETTNQKGKILLNPKQIIPNLFQ